MRRFNHVLNEAGVLTRQLAVSDVDKMKSRVGYLRLASQDLASGCTSVNSLNLSTGLRTKKWWRLGSALALGHIKQSEQRHVGPCGLALRASELAGG